MKAVALLSGGLDSVLAARLVKDQGIEVLGLHHVLPFASEKKDYVGESAEELSIPLRRVEAGDDYLAIVRNPEHGYGSQMNPCVDCRIYMLRRAARIAEEEGAAFVVTGDVLGQRPMTQTRNRLKLEEREAGLEGLILRPLSAKELPPTIPEEKGWVDREKLLGTRGRSRKPQIALARELNITRFRTPDSGCMLVNREFAQKLGDLFKHEDVIGSGDVELLKVGRHSYFGDTKVVVGRHERDNQRLLELSRPDDYLLEAEGVKGPITLVRGPKTDDSVRYAAGLTAKYSDATSGKVPVQVRGEGASDTVIVDLERP